MKINLAGVYASLPKSSPTASRTKRWHLALLGSVE
jgi:hypothetical protein